MIEGGLGGEVKNSGKMVYAVVSKVTVTRMSGFA